MKQIYFAEGLNELLWHRTSKSAIRWTTELLAHTAPRLTLNLAEKILCTPSRPKKRRALEVEFREERIQIYDRDLTIARAGTGANAVVFVHGWSGSRADFGAFYPALLEAGFSVVTFDHAGHGDSPSKTANIFLFVKAIEQVLAHTQRDLKVRAVVAHSMGASAAISALQGTDTPLVLLAPLVPLFEQLYRSVQGFGISSTWIDRLFEKFERDYGRTRAELDPTLNIKKLSNPLLVVQDRKDVYIPLEVNKTYFTPHVSASLVETEGLGHFRILKSPDVVARSLEFIKNGAD